MISSPNDTIAIAIDYCEALGNENPALATVGSEMADCLKQKLWHQLTLLVIDFTESQSDPDVLLGIYDKVVLAVESKWNPLSFARIATTVAMALPDGAAARALLENVLVKPNLQASARIYLESKHSLLLLAEQPKVFPESLLVIQKRIAQNASDLDDRKDATVHAAHYQQAMQYYKNVGPPEAFYEQAMSFLNYESSTDVQLAIDLCVAALTGNGVYNLGQVEQTPLLKLLIPDHEWLVLLLKACAAGDVTLFRQLSQQYAAEIQTQPALVHLASFVQEKLTLLALVHFVFESRVTTLKFQDLAARLQCDADVEYVIMRALSVHLIEGTMDQVDQTLEVTWVMPRVLNQEQLTKLADRFGEWAGNVIQTKQFMQTTIEAAF
jgi:26S proteasome regulatory subunit N9